MLSYSFPSFFLPTGYTFPVQTTTFLHRGHSDDQIRPLKPDDRPETTKEYVRWETEEEDTLTENKGDWGSRKGQDVPGSVWELRERLTLK